MMKTDEETLFNLCYWKICIIVRDNVDNFMDEYSELLLLEQKVSQAGVKCVRPLLSTNCGEAHQRVMALYRAVFRYIPKIVKYHDIEKSEQQVRYKLRELFYRNACVTDIRVIDLLVIKGWMEFIEIKNQWQQKGHILANWNPTLEPKRCDFLGKFLAGTD